jgi:site-specific recombinase XerC
MTKKTQQSKPDVVSYRNSDSVSAKFMKSALHLRRGGTLTHKKMHTTFERLAEVGKRWGDLSPATITQKQLTRYVEQRIADGISARTIQNECSHLRRAISNVSTERKIFANETCTNAVLGVPKGTRIGTRTAIDADVLASAIERADPGTRSSLLLMSGIGLRHLEANSVTKTVLKEWSRAIEIGQPLRVELGTKQDRPRSVFLSPESAEIAKRGIDEAIIFLRETGQKYLRPEETLEQAVRESHRALKALDVKGENSPHSIRDAWAVREYLAHRAAGCTKEESWARLCPSIGHSDKRGRWLFNNYLKATLERDGIDQ